MSSVAVQSGVPLQCESGETVRFLISDSDHPATAWTHLFFLNNGIDAPVSVAGTTSGTGFSVVLSAAFTAALKALPYHWQHVFTAISPTTEKEFGETGILEVLPNPTAQAVPSFAQSQVTLLETAITQLAPAGGFSSVSFNGQSYSIGNIGDLRSQLVFWKSQVISERRRINALRGIHPGGHIPVVFVNGAPAEVSR